MGKKPTKDDDIMVKNARFFSNILFFIVSTAVCSAFVPAEEVIIERFLLPSPWKESLDVFFKSNNLEGSASKIFEVLKDNEQLIKKIGVGSRAFVFAFPGFENQFVCKIAHHVAQDHSSFQQNKSSSDPRTWFLPCVIRENVSRVLQSARIRDCIQSKNLKNVKVPKKYLYHIPGAQTALTDENYIVIAEKLTLKDHALNPYENATKEQVFNLAKIMLETWFIDTADGNVEIDVEGNLVLPDTDEMWLYLLSDGLLNDDEFKKLALFCAQIVFEMLEQASGQEADDLTQTVLRNGKNLDLDAVLSKQNTEHSVLKKIILFYKNLTVLGAICSDINSLYPLLSEEDKKEILSYVLSVWDAGIGSDVNGLEHH